MNIEGGTFDGRIDKSHDLLDDLIVGNLWARVRARRYAAVTMAPPCSTCSAARGQDGGTKPLRSADAKSIYGLPDTGPESKNNVR